MNTFYWLAKYNTKCELFVYSNQKYSPSQDCLREDERIRWGQDGVTEKLRVKKGNIKQPAKIREE